MFSLHVILTLLEVGLASVTLPWVLLVKRRQPVSSVAWIMAIVFIPVLGSVLFLIFGINRVTRRTTSRSRLTNAQAGQRPQVPDYVWLPDSQVPSEIRQLVNLTRRISDTLPTTGNSIELLRDTNRTLGLIEQSVHRAKATIHLEYYIWQPDRTGSKLRDLLIEKARQGVCVRFLYDGFGSSGLSRRFLKPMKEAGIHTATFLPGQTFRERWSINLRNHRKIVVVDGTEAFTGGMNIGDEYLGRHQKYRFWRDAHLKISGPEVWRLQSVFAEDWLYATGESLWGRHHFPPFNTQGTVTAQTLSGGPDKDTDVFQTVMLGALNQATSHILLATSYFAPPSAIVAALENAAWRGVRVRLLVSCRWTHRATLLAGRSCYDSLLKAGVEIFEYQRGLLHSKTLTVDGRWSLVGSANLDCRSFFLNFEAGMALYDAQIASELEQQFTQDAADSRQITVEEWAHRPQYHVMAENLCRLFIPVL